MASHRGKKTSNVFFPYDPDACKKPHSPERHFAAKKQLPKHMCKGNDVSHFLLTQKFRFLGDLSMRKTTDVTLVTHVSMVSVYFLQKKRGGGWRINLASS